MGSPSPGDATGSRDKQKTALLSYLSHRFMSYKTLLVLGTELQGDSLRIYWELLDRPSLSTCEPEPIESPDGATLPCKDCSEGTQFFTRLSGHLMGLCPLSW